MKIALMDDLTIYVKKDKHYSIEIDENKVLAESIHDLEELKEPDPYFFNLKSVEHENGKYTLNYIVEEEFKPLISAKKYNEVMRLSLLDRLLEINPLQNFEQPVFIHPQNIFFQDLRTLKFLYRSNKWLPYDETQPLEQYKLLILSMLSQHSYEHFKLKKQELLQKEKNDFFYYINQARDVKELKALVSKEFYRSETKHFEDLEKNKKKKKNNITIKIVAGTLGTILLVTLVFGLVKMQTSEVEQVYQQKIEKQNDDLAVYKALSKDDINEAVTLLKKNGNDSSEIAQIYFDNGEYNKAIKEDKGFIKKVIQKLYDDGKEEDVLSLESSSQYVETEKKIIQYDYSYLLGQKALLSDKDQLIRLGYAFVKHGDLDDAREVYTRQKDEGLDLAIKIKEQEDKLNEAKKQLDQLKKKKDKDKDKKVKEQEKDIDNKTKELDKLKEEQKNLEKKGSE
ncbi:type VII secretion protein EssB/YukC (plasmid) [Bacillus subtilis]|uniref:Type VII secretion protein EssB/YukC n=1 Tax=Bacillus subtilis TaxID=1423 RepID=A0A8I2B725_BACIU|nr:type VII secretion protein EssB/YukC [Bacillus subtilis]MBO3796452.1 hypothetical protein [Bacillus subtilis]MCM3191288.1 hypothetical protein [Bacillus subtilis]WEY82953.1 type VII secretion protein EssB/YukC [Bacillus subtilis]